MTTSDKPERSGSSPQQQEADQSSVMTESTEDSAGTQAAEASSADGDVQAGEATDGASPGSGGEAGAQAEAPPPWQRSTAMADGNETTAAQPAASAPSSSAPAGSAPPPPDAEKTQTIPKAVQDEPTVRTEVPKQSTGSDGRSESGFGAAARSGTTATGRRPSRGPRRASLQIKRIDPWSVLKLALVLSVAMFFVWMIAVAVLYGVLEGMGVWDQLNGTFSDLTQPENLASDPIISAGRVFGVASIVGAINIVLFTALATVAAFIYNVASDFAGGVEVTLSERE